MAESFPSTLAAVEEVFVAVEAPFACVVADGTTTPAVEALFRANRTIERPDPATLQLAIGRFTSGALVGACFDFGRGRFTRRRGFEALLELRAVGGELLVELIAVVAQPLTSARQIRVVGIFLVTQRHQFATAFHVVGVGLALLK